MPAAMYDNWLFITLGTGTAATAAIGTDYLSDAITCTLHTATYVPAKATDSFVSNLTNEVAAGGGYATGGVALAGKTLALASSVITANATDPSWASSTITARVAVFSNRTPGTAATQPLIIYYLNAADAISSSGTFTVDIPAGGLFTLTIPAAA